MDLRHIKYHEKTMEILKRHINNKSVSHSYLFEGEEGIGKQIVSYVFSKSLLCKEGRNEPCNICSSCMKFDKGSHPDFFLIEPEKDIIRIHQIERIVEEMKTRPFESEKKIILINESDKMNLPSQNKLLKTLEEPPSFVHIFLLSSKPEGLLETILSRLYSVKIIPLKAEQVVEILREDYNKSKSEARFITSFSRAALEKSIQLAQDEEFFLRRDKLINILDALIRGDKSRVFSSMDFFNDNRARIDEILDMSLYWFRDIMVYQKTGDASLLINNDKLEELSYKRYMEFDKINGIIENIIETKANLRSNINFQLAIETLLLNI